MGYPFHLRGAIMKDITKHLKNLNKHLAKINRLNHMKNVIYYDMTTSCPKLGTDDHNDDINYLSNEIIRIINSKSYMSSVIYLGEHINDIDNLYDRRLVSKLYKDYLRIKNIDSKTQIEMNEIFNNGYLSWLEAKEKNDYSLFYPALNNIREATIKQVKLSSAPDLGTVLNNVMDSCEEGMNEKDLDHFFNTIKKAIIHLLRQISTSKVKIRTDFLNRKVPLYKQMDFSKYLLETIGYDMNKGAIGLTEHPYTISISKNDHRVTTHIYEDNFISNIYSVIHEGGHGIFGQNIPDDCYIHHIDEYRSLAMDESSSRFFENVIGRSKEFIHLIYPKFHEYFYEEFSDVTEEELYKAVNLVDPGLIRTEADELTYTLHIIIRYELEKEILNNNINLKDLNKLWNQKYKEYLGVDVPNDTLGVLQDVHWSGGFGYFPTYSLGNAYNQMYLKEMNKVLNVKELILNNNIKEIVNYLRDNVYKKACNLSASDWIKDICNEDLNPNYFIEYLTNKYKEIYELD